MDESQNEEVPQSEEDFNSNPYSLFIYALNSPETKVKYVSRLQKFFEFNELQGDSMEEKCQIFVKESNNNKKYALNCIIRFLQKQKARVERKEITGATVRNYVKTIKLLFCEMNEISIPWKRVTKGLPKARNYADDRAPTIEEIRKIIEYPDRRIKPIVCTMASPGIRLGAWDYLKWKYIIPIERKGKVIAAKIIVYPSDVEEYFTFITLEAYSALEKWMQYRQSSGENITGESWILRNVWDSRAGVKLGIVGEPKKLEPLGIKRIVETALWTQGVRKKLEKGKKRHEFQAHYGFRKWFKTRCELAGMRSINIEKLMGHSIGISDSYYRVTEDELLEDYLKAYSVPYDRRRKNTTTSSRGTRRKKPKRELQYIGKIGRKKTNRFLIYITQILKIRTQ